MSLCYNCIKKYSCEYADCIENINICKDYETIQINHSHTLEGCQNYEINIPIYNQTFNMHFQEYAYSFDTIYFYVCMSVYNKRKNYDKNFAGNKITGEHPSLTLAAAAWSFRQLEYAVLEDWNDSHNVVIVVEWSDNRRRDIYTRYLSRYGYEIAYAKTKCLMKKYEKGCVNNDEQ